MNVAGSTPRRQAMLVHARDGLDTVERADPVAKHGGVYDLTVEPDACFFASEILVHNKSME